MNDSNPECCLCIMFVSKKSNVSPRSRAIAASNENNFFHLLDSEAKSSSKCDAAIDMLHYPRAKITLRKGVFTSSLHWEG